MAKITPSQMIEQWAGLDHRLQINVHNFEVKAGQAAVEVFQDSFEKQQFNSSGSKRWAKWQGKYVGGKAILRETDTLKDSIKVKSIKKHTIEIHTDPAKFTLGPKRHKGFCYAAVHNNLDSLARKPTRGPKYERQFIGHSSVLQNRLENELSVLLFEGFPQ